MSYYQCGHCGMFHSSGACPRVKAIEYYPDGSIKRVEYHPPNADAPPIVITRFLTGELKPA